MPRPKKVSNLVKIEKDIVIDAEQYKAQEQELISLQNEFNKLVEVNKVLNVELQKVLDENKELKSQIVKIAVVDTHTRFVRKVDIVKLLKSFGKNEPDLKEWEIAIMDNKIFLTAITLSDARYSLPLSEAQKYQL